MREAAMDGVLARGSALVQLNRIPQDEMRRLTRGRGLVASVPQPGEIGLRIVEVGGAALDGRDDLAAAMEFLARGPHAVVFVDDPAPTDDESAEDARKGVVFAGWLFGFFLLCVMALAAVGALWYRHSRHGLRENVTMRFQWNANPARTAPMYAADDVARKGQI